MKKIPTLGRVFYGMALLAIAIQQLFYGDFCPLLFPHWPKVFAGYRVLVCLFSIALITACVVIIWGKGVGATSLVLGGVMLVMLLFGQIPYEYIVIPYKKTHLALWELPLKELALVGGALSIAGIEQKRNGGITHQTVIIRFLKKLIPDGPVFFSVTMICFGITHFMYTKTVANMVPSWMPMHYFWTYFAAVSLIGSGISIITGFWRKTISLLLGLMIFLWFILLHVPSAIKHPLLNNGNEIFSALSALAFSGIAFVISDDYFKTGD